jgi:hypothetical protein
VGGETIVSPPIHPRHCIRTMRDQDQDIERIAGIALCSDLVRAIAA